MKNKPSAAEIKAAMEEEEHQERLRQIDLIRNCITALFSGYGPAQPGQADNYFTTLQISNAIADHIGERVANNLIFEYLTGEGYEYARAGHHAELRWLLKSQG